MRGFTTLVQTVPDWREEHPSYWKEVDKRTRGADLEDSDQVKINE